MARVKEDRKRIEVLTEEVEILKKRCTSSCKYLNEKGTARVCAVFVLYI